MVLQWLVLLLATSMVPFTMGSAVHAEPLEDALLHVAENVRQSEERLLELASIPSISAQVSEHRSDFDKAAKWLQKRMAAIGLKGARIMETEGPHAVVYAEWLEAPDQPTVLIYGHYDVQPVDPLELWYTDPFKPVIHEGKFWGRGVDDDKGGLLTALEGMDAWFRTWGKLPVNVKVLLEGQEEVGSPDLPAFLEKHRELLAADYALSADGSQLSEEEPSIVIGLRGALGLQVTHQTLSDDVHSGLHGGSVANPLHTLADLVASFHHPNGTIAVDGFYDSVREVTAEDLADIAANPVDVEAELAAIGASGGFGEAGQSTTARTWLRPTLEAVGMFGGFTGDGIKTIVPAKASVKLACRLVPDQDPAAVLEALSAHVHRHSSPLANTTVTPLGWFAKPFVMERDTVVNRAAAKVLKKVMGRKPYFVRIGGTIPAAALIKSTLGIDITMFAFGLPTDHIHSPNERFPQAMYHKGIEAYVRILYEIGAINGNSAASARKEAAKSQTGRDEL
mmetsp:Transcript_19066/g.57602  ORF Transcript_19066/g.57602 Transcript_19066/m.57602 type:complete len:508 (-) Transcript_19066:681-2204(-)